jgi:hypothetical protein
MSSSVQSSVDSMASSVESRMASMADSMIAEAERAAEGVNSAMASMNNEVVGGSIVPDMVADVEAVLADWDMADIVADAAARGREAIDAESQAMRQTLAALGATEARPTIAPAGVGVTGPSPTARPTRVTPTTRPSRRSGPSGSDDGEREVTVRLAVDGDDELERLIRENATVVVDERRERDNRAIQRGRRQ